MMLSILFGIAHVLGLVNDTSYDLLIFSALYIGGAVRLTGLTISTNLRNR